MMLTGLARVAREAGITVREVPGWKTRTAHRGGMTEVRGVIWHHTATSADMVKSRNNPTLNYMVSGLGYPLANYGLAWDGSLDVIAAGTGAHAGKGVYKGIPRDNGNRYLIGVEVEGTIGLRWSDAQLETAARLGAQLDREFGKPLLHIGHYEWGPGRKTDPTGIPGNMPALRAAIKRGTWGAAITPAATTTAQKEDDMTPAQEAKLDRALYLLDSIPQDVWGHEFAHPRTGNATPARAFLASGYANGQAVHAMIAAVAEKSGIDPIEVERIIRDAIEKGLAAGVELEAKINVKEK